MAETFLLDPDNDADYTFDFATELNSTSPVDTISSYVLTADSGLTIDTDSNNTTSVTTFVNGGTAGANYELACDIVTNGGRSFRKVMVFKVRVEPI